MGHLGALAVFSAVFDMHRFEVSRWKRATGPPVSYVVSPRDYAIQYMAGHAIAFRRTRTEPSGLPASFASVSFLHRARLGEVLRP